MKSQIFTNILRVDSIQFQFSFGEVHPVNKESQIWEFKKELGRLTAELLADWDSNPSQQQNTE